MSDLYDEFQPTQEEADFGNQHDSLNKSHEQDLASGLNNPSFQAGAEKPAKKKLSLVKKVGYGVGSVFGLLVVGVIALDATAPPAVNPRPVPPKGQAAAQPEAGLVAGASTEAGSTLMTGGVQPADVAAADAQNRTPEQPLPVAPAAVVVAAAPAHPAAAPAPVAPAPAQAASAPAQSPAPPKREPVAPKAPTMVMAAPAPAKNAPAIKTAEATGSTDKALVARLARLEKKLAQYELAQGKQSVTKPASAAVRAAPARTVVVDGTALAAAAPAPATPSSILSGDEVRVIGVTTRQGVTAALLEFGGVKHRVAVGEKVPGLGPVSSIAVDASGAGVVQINGIAYH